MKCPICGAEMLEGHLYCEHCGEDIHIVPDFEPELELNMEQSLEHILKDVAQQERRDTENTQTGTGAENDRQGKKLMSTVGWIAIGTLLLFAAVCGVQLFQYYSLDYQTERAKQAVVSGKYERAIQHYTRAMELDRFDISLKLELAEVYFLKNDKVEYENLLNEIVADPNTNTEQLESAYGKLIAIYRAREDYQTISDMLLECENETICSTYQSYLAEAPQFGVPEGSYTEVKALKLTITGKGTIYYTLNGSIPDEASERYTAPILLENGDYIVKAVFVNENGVSSEVSTAEYHISVEELEAPELNVDAGEYNIPVLITVVNDVDDIYYTTDGTTPAMTSAQYTEPIPMPLGVSTFKFARLKTGRSSTVVERTFTLELNAEVSPEQAVNAVRENALSSGKILDHSGHFDDTSACYQYQYLYTIRIDGSGDYYVVAEMFADPQGIANRTGNYFAIDIHSGACYKLQTENGSYRLVDISSEDSEHNTEQ